MSIIINCDDFGQSEPINYAVREAHMAGRLSSATLLVNGSAVEHAVSIARECPELGIGLHLDLDEFLGYGIDGYYGHTLSNVNPQRYQWTIQHLSNVERRIREQFAKFFSLGIDISHVDGHHHVQLLPRVFDSVLGVACEYGVHRMRFFKSFYEADSQHCKRHVSQLSQLGFRYAAGFRDFSHLELSDILEHDVTEIMVHISTGDTGSKNWRVRQLERLISQDMKVWCDAHAARLVNYTHL